ncbi:hemerythrin HHE cation binding domain protein [Mycobacterium kansasii]|uniref:Hemerythrin HHE cation binding domain protein n=1 Tax=Mycobacterium kansasii TaxID=1768 RepID=A0A1V3X4L5_MYCKA|nr:hemerythrin HHE cation binding domain protein [Mycobacterium kansasii]
MRAVAQPADTRMMGIVHNALRRDIARAQSALARWPYPNPRQRSAVAEHLVWMTEFLHRHHRVEDDGLYPLVRQRVSQAAGILDAMDADHHALLPAIARLTDSARRYAADPSARLDLVTTLDRLAAVLLPHLQREELEMMPVVSEALTQAEWDAIEQAHAVKPLKPTELAFTALWLCDGASDEDRAIVRSLVPKPVARAIEIFATPAISATHGAFGIWRSTPGCARNSMDNSASIFRPRSRRCGSWSPIRFGFRSGATSVAGCDFWMARRRRDRAGDFVGPTAAAAIGGRVAARSSPTTSPTSSATSPQEVPAMQPPGTSGWNLSRRARG